MSDAGRTRPMTEADYRAGEAVPVRNVDAHPMRDLVLGAVFGAAALWFVPRVLDQLAAGGWLPVEEDAEDYELEDVDPEELP